MKYYIIIMCLLLSACSHQKGLKGINPQPESYRADVDSSFQYSYDTIVRNGMASAQLATSAPIYGYYDYNRERPRRELIYIDKDVTDYRGLDNVADKFYNALAALNESKENDIYAADTGATITNNYYSTPAKERRFRLGDFLFLFIGLTLVLIFLLVYNYNTKYRNNKL